MAKKQTTTRKRATKEQVARIDELGKQIYGADWDARIRESIVKKYMTENKAKTVILQFGHVLGGKV
jgi:hypothetical protein